MTRVGETVRATLAWVNPHHYAEVRNQLERLRKEYAAFAIRVKELGAEYSFQPPGVVDQATGDLILKYALDNLAECEVCRRRAPCRLLSDGSPSGESDWRCAWGCPPPEERT